LQTYYFFVVEMLGRTIFKVALFSEAAKGKLIKVNVSIDGQIRTYHFPEGSKLAHNLEKAKIPMEFECGYGCRCGTCPLTLS